MHHTIQSFLKYLSETYSIEYSELEQHWTKFDVQPVLFKWLNQMNLDSLFCTDILPVVERCQMTIDDLEHILQIISSEAWTQHEFESGDFFQQLEFYFGASYTSFLYELALLCPSGLNNSPNASCGKFELLLLLILPSKKTSGKGDILFKDIYIEIRGNQMRLKNKNVTGIQYRNAMNHIRERYRITGNEHKKGSSEQVFEPEKSKYREHYKQEFERLDDPTIFIDIFTEAIGVQVSFKDISLFYQDQCWNYDKFIQVILLKLAETSWDGSFHELWWFGDYGKKFRRIKSIEHLKELILSRDIVQKSDYFRINQPMPIGWYVE